MYTRLKRPLLAAVVVGSLLAGGTVFASPALADPATSSSTSADPSASASTDAASSTTDTSGSTPETGSSSAGDTNTTVPGTGSGGTGTGGTDPGSADPDPTGSTPSSGPTTMTPPPADTTAPAGSFRLSLFAVWVGQQTTLTLGPISDNGGDPTLVTRVVTWGDGTSLTLPVTTTSVTKQYTRAGKFPITLTLTDAAGNRTEIKSGGVTVTQPGKVTLSKKAVWNHESFNIAVSGVPAGTTKIVIYTGDGYARTLSGKNQTFAKSYYLRPNGTVVPPGTVTLTAVFTNKNGSSAQFVVGRIAIYKDSWAPKVTITKPKNVSSAKAWSTIRGTASDKGSGVSQVIVVVLRTQGTNVYCYTAKKKWMLLTNSLNVLYCLQGVKLTKGKWSLAVKGQKKGTTLDVLAVAGDWADRTASAELTRKLTKA